MTDDSSSDVDLVNERKAKDAERVKLTQQKMLGALEDHGTAMYQQGWFIGWDTGFDEGWKRAAEFFTEQAQAEKLKVGRALPTTPSGPAGRTEASRTRTLTASELVLRRIASKPGERGIAIVNSLKDQLPERTVRTALHRLRGKRIVAVEGRWYLLGREPAPQPIAGEEE